MAVEAGPKGPTKLQDDNYFWKIYEKGETIGRGHFAKVKLVRHRRRRATLRPAHTNRNAGTTQARSPATAKRDSRAQYDHTHSVANLKASPCMLALHA